MKNIKIVLEYDGTNFFGWQIQPDKRSVQGELEKAIKRITGEDIRIIGSGRTDRGVHAISQVANFFIYKEFDKNDLKRGLNAVLPEDIYIKSLEEVDMDFNSRFDATSRVYRYYILIGRSPLKRNYVWELDKEIDLDKANEVAKIFLGERDFRFLSTKDEGICNVIKSFFFKEDKFIVYEIEANRFLRRMVRHILGTIISVCIGKLFLEDINKIFNGKKRSLLLPPPQGLYLWEVRFKI